MMQSNILILYLIKLTNLKVVSQLLTMVIFKKMKNTIRGIQNHKIVNIFAIIKSDILHKATFNFLKKSEKI